MKINENTITQRAELDLKTQIKYDNQLKRNNVLDE